MGLLDLNENTNLYIDILKGYVEKYHAKYNYTNYKYKWCDKYCDWPDENDLIYRPALNTRFIFKSVQNDVIYLAVNKLNGIDDKSSYMWWYHVDVGNYKSLWATLEDVINEMGPE